MVRNADAAGRPDAAEGLDTAEGPDEGGVMDAPPRQERLGLVVRHRWLLRVGWVLWGAVEFYRCLFFSMYERFILDKE